MESNTSQRFIAPIAVDVGAVHTGLYRAIYPQHSRLADIKRDGEVLSIDEKGSTYTVLLRQRTAMRHMRRVTTRRKLAKRLLNLILNERFGFAAQRHAQALGYLMNRRGYTRLEDDFILEALDDIPESAWLDLPERIRELLGNDREALRKTVEQALSGDEKRLRALHEQMLEISAPLAARNQASRLATDLKRAIKAPPRASKKAGNSARKPRLTTESIGILGNAGVTLPSELRDKPSSEAFTGWLETVEEARLHTLDEELTKAIEQLALSPRDSCLEALKPSEFTIGARQQERLDSGDPKTHLQHLAFGIHQAASALGSGSRHRRDYFKELLEELSRLDRHPHRYLKDLGMALETSLQLDAHMLGRLISHVGNLELKPLRAYFNDPAHKNSDQWQPCRLTDIVSRWFGKQWRVSETKDGKQAVLDHRRLITAWRAHPEPRDIVAFWLDTDPELTIPPYQSQTNRHPPDCQSLVLNPTYLDARYPDWRNWLEAMDEKLSFPMPDWRRLNSRKGKPLLATDTAIALRRIQFLLDRAKGDDPFLLNQLWSHFHRLGKTGVSETIRKQTLKELIGDLEQSQLPETLKRDLHFMQRSPPRNSFGHFINRYYQDRRKARDQRYFLHPRGPSTRLRPGYLADDDSLLTLCAHRPRQKRHQAAMDFSALVGLTPDELTNTLGGDTVEAVESLLIDIKGFKTAARDAANAQKDHRGVLKIRLADERATGRHTDLVKLDDKVKRLAEKLTERLWPDIPLKKRGTLGERFSNIFSFAQIHNIVFRDRSGFSSTCPVCTTDNAWRMRRNDSGRAAASRLPALSIRLIDGAVKRLFEYKSARIVELHWQDIRPLLEQGHAVEVPLIMEQNRFEFEPSLAKIKNRQDNSRKRDTKARPHADKSQRLRQATQGLCAYTGMPLDKRAAQIDHIIPRASRFGVLNDEANLILVTELANQNKRDQQRYLHDLDSRYLANIYRDIGLATPDIATFASWIRKVLTRRGDRRHFSFGEYHGFIDLEPSQQIAFRHALFLADDDSVKQRVIAAIRNRRRAHVNGTQRYFAQKIADGLRALATRNGFEGRLSFDYLEYPAGENGTQALRGQIPGLAKEPIQEKSSHHIDAHMAFLLAVEEHPNDGRMRIRREEHESVWPVIDAKSGEIHATAYRESRVPRTELTCRELERRSTGRRINNALHARKPRTLEQVIRRQIFHQNAIAPRYRPLFFYREQWYRGYPIPLAEAQWDVISHAQPLTGKQRGKAERGKAEGIVEGKRFYRLRSDRNGLKLYLADHTAIHLDALDLFSRTPEGLDADELARYGQLKWLAQKLRYYLTKHGVEEAPRMISDKRNRKHPLIREWERFDSGWRTRLGGDPPVKDGEYLINSETRPLWDDYLEGWFGKRARASSAHARTSTAHALNAIATPSGTPLLVERNGQFHCITLDNKEIAKEQVPFAVLGSRRLAWFHGDAMKALREEIPEVDTQPLDQDIPPEILFTEELMKQYARETKGGHGQLALHANKNQIRISGLPSRLFRRVIRNGEWNESKQTQRFPIRDINPGDQLPVADRAMLRQWLRIPPRGDDSLFLETPIPDERIWPETVTIVLTFKNLKKALS